MAYPGRGDLVPVHEVGDVPTSTELNWPWRRPALLAYRSSVQSIATATYTAVAWNAESWDTAGMHSTSTQTERLWIRTPGAWEVTAQVAFSSNATGARTVVVRKNGVAYVARLQQMPATGVATISPVHAEVTVAAGDYLEVLAYQSSGGNLDVAAGRDYTWVSARWLRAS